MAIRDTEIRNDAEFNGTGGKLGSELHLVENFLDLGPATNGTRHQGHGAANFPCTNSVAMLTLAIEQHNCVAQALIKRRKLA